MNIKLVLKKHSARKVISYRTLVVNEDEEVIDEIDIKYLKEHFIRNPL